MGELTTGRVLVVDDDELVLRTCVAVLSKAGLSCESATDTAEALSRIGRQRYDAVLTDIRMPGLDGIELLRAAHEQDATLPFVLMTGSPTLESAMSAVELRAMHYLMKPFRADELARVVGSAVAARVRCEADELSSQRLSSALEQLWMAYQPIVRLTTRRVFACEALLRSRATGVNGPAEILGLAERTNRLFDVGRAVRGQVARDLERLEPGVLMFVNLHPRELADPELYAPSSPLSSHASRVVLEVTERASLEELDDLPARFEALRAVGYRVAIDDLGTGYAGLTALADVRPDFVKIDGSLVKGIETDVRRRVLVASLLAASRELRTDVVVEGVETKSQQLQLAGLGVDLMQGYFFARPQPAFATVCPEALAA